MQVWSGSTRHKATVGEKKPLSTENKDGQSTGKSDPGRTRKGRNVRRNVEQHEVDGLQYRLAWLLSVGWTAPFPTSRLCSIRCTRISSSLLLNCIKSRQRVRRGQPIVSGLRHKVLPSRGDRWKGCHLLARRVLSLAGMEEAAGKKYIHPRTLGYGVL